jgi:hypothetical protein
VGVGGGRGSGRVLRKSRVARVGRGLDRLC